MRQIRKLFFKNASGQIWGLNGERGVYASNLSGFGFSMGTSFANLKRGFFSPVSTETEPQNPLAFTLTFTRTAYDTYKALVDWLSTAGTISIGYDPTGKQAFYRDVTINSLSKGELNEVGWLEVPCSFLCKAPWYSPVVSSMILQSDADATIKRYTYQYTPELKYGSDGRSAASGTIPQSGHIPAALELSYCGRIENPVIRLAGKRTGRIYGICALHATIEENEIFKLCTRYENSCIKKVYASGEEADLLNYVDLNPSPFFRVPVDESCEISIEAEHDITGVAELLIYYYFRSV